MIINGIDLISEIRKTTKGWINLKLAADYIEQNYILVNLKTFEVINDINIYQDIIAEECRLKNTECPYVYVNDDPFVNGCICCLCDAINRRDDLAIDKK